MSKETANENIVSTINNEYIDKSLESMMHDSMIPYAEYVILDRALPRVEDGLKPVQRRILYSMRELGITPDKPYRKSARIVGDCLGKYHPHGDRSVYDAMVRLAQPFNLRMPLVDGHGNFGSVDGDSAAAMRYTEARLAPLAMELLRDLDKDTVPFSLNFDDTTKEPDMLPGRFPNLLVNGSSGIAVGLATNIPPHNLAESIDAVIAYIDNKNISLKALMKIIKGPDFPTGGYIIAGDELERAYETGKGRLILRAKIDIENAENGKLNIVITELPYQVNKATLLQKILELKESKKDLLAGIYDIADESDRSGMRAVIKVKKDYDPYEILKVLYKSTDLETTFGVNIVAIADGKPQQMGLCDILYYYINYQRDVVLRRTRFEFKEAKEREHLLDGLVIAVRNIDEVVRIIKKSENTTQARNNLRDRFKLSERQAQAILDMRLARLTSLEIYKLEEELKEIKALVKKLQAILDSKKAQMDVVKEEMLAIKRQYKQPRRSVVVASAEDVEVSAPIEKSDTVDDFAVVLNASGGIKRVPIKNYNMSTRSLGDKSTPSDIAKLIVETQNNATIMMFTNKGNCYKVDCQAIPECRWKEKGQPLSRLVQQSQEGEQVIMMYPVLDELPLGSLLFFTKLGSVKKTDWSEYGLLKSAYQAIKLKDDDEVINIENDAANTSMVFMTSAGIVLNADKDDLPTQGRIAGGVKGIALGDDDFVVFAGQVSKEGALIAVTEKGMFKRVKISEFDIIGRYRKGVKFIDMNAQTGKNILYGGYTTLPAELALMCEDSEILAFNTDDIPLTARGTKPKPVKTCKSGVCLSSASIHRSCGQYITVQSKF